MKRLFAFAALAAALGACSAAGAHKPAHHRPPTLLTTTTQPAPQPGPASAKAPATRAVPVPTPAATGIQSRACSQAVARAQEVTAEGIRHSTPANLAASLDANAAMERACYG